MIVASAVLLVVGIVAFAIGLFAESFVALATSIGTSIAASITLFIGVRQDKRRLASASPPVPPFSFDAEEPAPAEDFAQPLVSEPPPAPLGESSATTESVSSEELESLFDEPDAEEPGRVDRLSAWQETAVGEEEPEPPVLAPAPKKKAARPAPKKAAAKTAAAAKKTAAKKAAPKKTAAPKKAAPKKTAAKPAAKKAAAPKKTAAKPAAKKPAAKKPAAKKAAPKKTAAKPTAGKKTAPKKAAPRKPAAKPAAKKTPKKK
ncbi:MAG TPA: hypothetical protein VGB83_11975 [Actinomycetota bacterium]